MGFLRIFWERGGTFGYVEGWSLCIGARCDFEVVLRYKLFYYLGVEYLVHSYLPSSLSTSNLGNI